MLIGISGKKQAGKDSVYQYLYENMRGGPHVEQHSFADLLKRNVCMDIFGLSCEACYGTDDDKNTLTELKWEDIRKLLPNAGIQTKFHFNHAYYPRKEGYMTAREVLQVVGTRIFRTICPDVWVKASLRKLDDDPSFVAAVFTDARFPNEVLSIKAKGGKVIRLTRNPLNDPDDSETALDQDKFDWANFDAVVDNEHMTLEEQGRTCLDLILGWHKEFA